MIAPKIYTACTLLDANKSLKSRGGALIALCTFWRPEQENTKIERKDKRCRSSFIKDYVPGDNLDSSVPIATMPPFLLYGTANIVE